MKIWERIAGTFATRPRPLVAEPLCVQDGSLRAYIWPADRHFNYEIVGAKGEKLSVGARADMASARARAVRLLADLRDRC